MFKAKVVSESTSDIIEMDDMEPCQIGIVVDSKYHDNLLVMRTASKTKFEVMQIGKPGVDKCWTGSSTLKVKLLPKGTKIELTVGDQ